MVVEFSLEKVNEVAKHLLARAEGYQVLALHGPMGVGKTTLITAMCRELGITDTISSPTFSIINEYQKPGSAAAVFHIDLYRLQSKAEAVNAGVEDCLYNGGLSFVEWPEKFPEIFPPQTLHCKLTIVGESLRRLEIIL